MKKNEIFNTASSFNKFEIQNYYQNEPRFNGVHSRNNLTEKLNLPGIHWVALFCNKKQVI